MQRTVSEPPNTMNQEEEITADRVKDDMANRRISSHIPAPLRRKKTEEQYKRFITPTGNPVVYLQHHMRSKSMSDLAEEKREEEIHRAEINERYEEMEKLKVLLKEEEDTWTTKLSNWKTRRRSMTEDARKRKQERDILEKETEHKHACRKTKTYKEIVEDKMRREEDLANLIWHDNDQHEVFTRPQTSASEISPYTPYTTNQTNMLMKAEVDSEQYSVHNRGSHAKSASCDEFSLSSSDMIKTSNPPTEVQYKFTSKVTAVISPVPTSSESSSSEIVQMLKIPEIKDRAFDNKFQHNTHPQENKMPQSTTGSMDFIASTMKPVSQNFVVPRNNQEDKVNKSSIITLHMHGNTSSPSGLARKPRNNVPNVLMRTKNPNAIKERPKSAHDLYSGGNSSWTSSLPRNFNDHSTPKPFVPGSSNFAQYRKTAFASRRNMWENISKPESIDVPKEEFSFHPSNKIQVKNNTAKEEQHSDMITSSSVPRMQKKQALEENAMHNTVKHKIQAKVTSYEHPKTSSKIHHINIHPSKVPLVSAVNDTQKSNHFLNKFTPSNTHVEPVKNPGPTATLTSGGLNMRASRTGKELALSKPASSVETLFDDMKICINQRPRSEKGFGFTVRGGDDGKPVIVDTVSPGGAADVCHLCVSDEILAINDVPLADCKTQDDIVQLIVSSVITGHLSLNIRRYGKTKKASPLRLTGTKVVMTPGGFVQVRSDKGSVQQLQSKTPHVSNLHKELPTPASERHNIRDSNNNQNFIDDLPPPPTQQELENVEKYDVSHNPRRPQFSQGPHADRAKSSSDDSYPLDALAEVHSNKSNDHEAEEYLHQEVLDAQKALEFEEVYEHYDQQRKKEEQKLRMKLLEEQRLLELEEAQREAARRKYLEEARLEDLHVEEELRRIQAIKLEKQQRRMEKEQTRPPAESANTPNVKMVPIRPTPSNGLGMSSGISHWMIEEAERRRVADMEGRPRINPLDHEKKADSKSGRGLPQHVIQRLTERTSKPRSVNTNMQDSVSHFWNDPSAKATLL